MTVLADDISAAHQQADQSPLDEAALSEAGQISVAIGDDPEPMGGAVDEGSSAEIAVASADADSIDTAAETGARLRAEYERMLERRGSRAAPHDAETVAALVAVPTAESRTEPRAACAAEFPAESGAEPPAASESDATSSTLQADADDDGDTVTILTSLGPRLAKEWNADGQIAGYDKALWFRADRRRIRGLAELSVLLSEIENDPRRCVVRGSLREDWQEVLAEEIPKWRERAASNGGHLVQPEPRAILRRKALFDDGPHHWVMLDIDGFRPSSADPVLEPVKAINEYIRDRLPEGFRGRSYHWQLSGSAGHSRNVGVLKAHIWFWLETPRSGTELRAWAQHECADLDLSIFNPVQVHYTARPVFGEGVVDPVPVRSAFEDRDVFAPGVDLEIDPTLLAAMRDSCEHAPSDLVDPREKPGVIGAFHRAFTIEDVLDQFLADQFESTSGDRLTWLGSRSGQRDGAFIRADRQGVGANHASWPWGPNKTANKWDLVRHFHFGHLDEEVEDAGFDELPPHTLPSHREMMAWAPELPEVQAELEQDELAREDRAREAFEATTEADRHVAESALRPSCEPPDKARSPRLSLERGRIEFIDGDPPERDFVFKGLPLVAGTACALVGPGGSSKTQLAMQMADSLAQAGGLFDVSILGASILLLGEEDDAERDRRFTAIARALAGGSSDSGAYRTRIQALQERVVAYGMAGKSIALTRALGPGLATSQTAFVGEIVQAAKGHAAACGLPVRLIVIDHARLAVGGNANASEDATAATRACAQIASETGALVLLLGHTNKSALKDIADGKDLGAGAMSGSQAFIDNTRGALALVPAGSKGSDLVKLVAVKANYGPTGDVATFSRVVVPGFGVAVLQRFAPYPRGERPGEEDDAEERNASIAHQILDVVRGKPGQLTRRRLRGFAREPINASKDAIDRLVEQLLASGELTLGDPPEEARKRFGLRRGDRVLSLGAAASIGPDLAF